MLTLKAIVFEEYGQPDVLQLRDVEKPTPKDDEVLIKVHAASINDWDWGNVRGKPFVNRMILGIMKPKTNILGGDIAGRVVAVGKNVKKYSPGDDVFGDLCDSGWGGFAEYVCGNENSLTLKPAGMTYEQAAAMPQAGLLALQGLRDYGEVKPGQKVLINGAGGGAGTFAIQIAKSFGAEITGVDKTSKLDKMRSLGADHVIDYTKEDFTRNGKCYDLIVDNAAHHSVFDYKRALSPNGIYGMVGGASGRIFQVMALGPLISMAGRKKIGIVMHKPNKGLADMIELFEAGKCMAVIDSRYRLSEVPEALRYFGDGNAIGKIIITMEEYL